MNQTPQNYESRAAPAPVRQTSPQMQYLPSPVEYKAKPAPATVNARSFKMPSPPVTPQVNSDPTIAFIHFCGEYNDE